MKRTHHRSQQGVVLFVALIVLVIMALAGVAMIRQASTGLGVAGNIALRQNAITGADLGTEAGLTWLRTKLSATPAFLNNNSAADGYYSDWGNNGTPEDLARIAGDPSKYDWTKGVSAGPADPVGNSTLYIVERLCELPNAAESAAGQHCVQSVIKDGGDYSGTCDHYASGCFPPPKATHYRISSQTTGPRGTVSYIQVMLKPT